MAGNVILNNTYTNVTYNILDNNTAYIHNGNYRLYYNNNMSNFAKDCKNLNYNLQNLNISYDYVTDMSYAYSNCYHLVGSPVIGPNVSNMYSAYNECRSINSPIKQYGNGYNIQNLDFAFFNTKTYGNFTWNYPNTNVRTSYTFYRPANYRNQLNLYVGNNLLFHKIYYDKTIVGLTTWTNMNNNCYYNTAQNFYVIGPEQQPSYNVLLSAANYNANTNNITVDNVWRYNDTQEITYEYGKSLFITPSDSSNPYFLNANIYCYDHWRNITNAEGFYVNATSNNITVYISDLDYSIVNSRKAYQLQMTVVEDYNP